ncbi:MAG: hypothetical protein ABI687_10800, partial [Flavitalea sp.]
MKRMKSMILMATFALTTISGCKTKSADQSNPPLLEVSAENMEGIDQSQWSDVKETEGRKMREALNNGAVKFTLPAWWGNTARPANGEIFIMEIDYKDVLKDPFIVSSFGNCENSLDSLSELHRLTVENNSEWKTAYIPVSYDYLYAGEGNPTGSGRQEFSIQLGDADKAIP